jgi:hypothetical protein
MMAGCRRFRLTAMAESAATAATTVSPRINFAEHTERAPVDTITGKALPGAQKGWRCGRRQPVAAVVPLATAIREPASIRNGRTPAGQNDEYLANRSRHQAQWERKNDLMSPAVGGATPIVMRRLISPEHAASGAMGRRAKAKQQRLVAP